MKQLITPPNRLLAIGLSVIILICTPIAAAFTASAVQQTFVSSSYRTYRNKEYDLSFTYPRHLLVKESEDTSSLYAGSTLDIQGGLSRDSRRSYDSLTLTRDIPMNYFTVTFTDYHSSAEHTDDLPPRPKETLMQIALAGAAKEAADETSYHTTFTQSHILVDGKDALVLTLSHTSNSTSDYRFFEKRIHIYEPGYSFEASMSYPSAEAAAEALDTFLTSIRLPRS